MNHARITIIPPHAPPYVVRAEVAITPEEQQKGLSHRYAVPAGTGMLFLFDQARYWPFTMKGVLVPLDMLFLDDRWNIVDVRANQRPGSEGPIMPRARARYVLELLGGEASRRGIEFGSRVLVESA